MINLQIENRKFRLPEKWSEITLKEYIKIYQLIKQNEIKAKEIDVNTFDEFKKSPTSFESFENVKLNKLIFKEMSGLDDSIIDRTNEKDILEALRLMGQFLNSKIENTKRESFYYKDKHYWFPEIDMKKSTFGDYIEAAQLDMLNDKLEGGRFEAVAEQMAILCKEEGEVYDEIKIEKKKKIFMNLTMDVVWDFVFFLTKQINHYKTNIQTYLKTV